MNGSFLFYSPPGSSDYKYFREAENGTTEFFFVSFRGFLRIDVSMEAEEEPSDPHFYFRPSSELPQETSPNEYASLVSDAISKMRSENLGKIVTSRAAVHPHPGHTVELFKKVQKAYPNAAVYLFSHPACGTWLGATPETLLKKTADKIETVSLAGTRNKTSLQKFTNKEVEEQQIVTDYIADIFTNEVGLKNTRVDAAEEVEAGNLFHYQSKIQAEITENFDFNSFINKLHPTPAVGGLPLNKSLDFIMENEKYNRTFYTGYFGVKQGADFHFFVNLRCMQLFEDKMALYAGGGITKASHPKAEYEETQAKMNTLLNVVDELSP